MRETKTYKECVEFIEEIESDFPVNDWKIKDFELWPYIRMELTYYLTRPNTAFSLEAPSLNPILTFLRNKKKKLYGFMRRISGRGINSDSFLSLNKNDDFRKKIDVLYLAQSSTLTNINEKWYNIFFDPINEYLLSKNKKFLGLEFANGVYIRNPKWFDIYLNLNNLFNSEPAINRYWTEPFEVQLTNYVKFLQYLINVLGGFPKTLSLDKIEYKANELYYNSLFFQSILKKTSPELIIITCYYFDIGFSICHAASRLKIKTVDMQHGAQHFWPAYSDWKTIPIKGYSTLPDIFWNWSELDTETINKWAKRTTKHKAFNFGNTWLMSWNSEKNHVSGKFSLPSDLFHEYRKKYSHIILFTTQPFYDKASIPDFIKKACISSPDWLWLIRIHPRQIDQLVTIRDIFFNNTSIPNVVFEESSLLPLPFLLKFVDMHVTEESAALIEASLSGISTIITSKNGCDLYSDYITSGVACFCQPNPDSIIEKINTHKFVKSNTVGSKDKSFEEIMNMLFNYSEKNTSIHTMN